MGEHVVDWGMDHKNESLSPEELDRAWHRILQDLELARHYPKIYALASDPAPRNPLLDALLPLSFYLRIVSLMDEAMASHMADKGFCITSGQQHDLYHRIGCLASAGVLSATQTERLHHIRRRRRVLAHGSTPTYPDWPEVDELVHELERLLRLLTFVSSRPEYEFFVSAQKVESSADPGILESQRCEAGLFVEGHVLTRFAWRVDIYRDKDE